MSSTTNSADYAQALRGIFTPIIDMRIKFKLGAPAYDPLTVVIILNIAGRVMGLVVDSVSDILILPLDQVRPAPEIGGAVGGNYLIGLSTIEERMLMDIDKLMSGTDMGLIEKLAA